MEFYSKRLSDQGTSAHFGISLQYKCLNPAGQNEKLSLKQVTFMELEKP